MGWLMMGKASKIHKDSLAFKSLSASIWSSSAKKARNTMEKDSVLDLRYILV